jgi:hypothetical protein
MSGFKTVSQSKFFFFPITSGRAVIVSGYPDCVSGGEKRPSTNGNERGQQEMARLLKATGVNWPLDVVVGSHNHRFRCGSAAVP